MLFWGGKSLAKSGLLRGITDHHTHILPGVDDGVQSVDEALEILDWYESLGVQRVHLTPHVMEDYPLNSASYLRERFEEFRSHYTGGIELRLGAEYMLDTHFREHLMSGDLLTIEDGMVLVELSYFAEPMSLMGSLQEILSRGYFVVLAHPERYLYMKNSDYEQLKKMGIRLQLNLPSLAGGYGESVRRRAEYLLKRGYYTFVGSDIHSHGYHTQLYNDAKISKRQLERVAQITRETEK